MAPSFMKKTMVYLGLLDAVYDEYDNLVDRAPRGFSSTTRVDSGRQEVEQPDEYAGGMSRIRTIPRESAVPNVRPQAPPVAPRTSSVRPVPVDTAIPGTPQARVHVVAPSRFGDAKEIADRESGRGPFSRQRARMRHRARARMER